MGPRAWKAIHWLAYAMWPVAQLLDVLDASPLPAPGRPPQASRTWPGFVTYAHLRGASDRAIAHQTRHRSLATLGMYVRIHEAWEDNAATMLGL